MMIHVMDRPQWLPRRRRRQWQKALLAACAVGLLWRAVAVVSAQDLTKSEIHTRALRGNLKVLVGYGGNIAVSTGPDGTLLVDDEYAALTPTSAPPTRTATP